jgi:hypothetical protein
MPETVKLSFEGAFEEAAPRTVIYNPGVMPFALYTQVERFGLVGTRKTHMSGKLKGSRHTLTEVIKSYGLNVEIVPPTAV